MIRQNDEEERKNFPCRHSSCEICKTLKPGKEFKSIEYVKNNILVKLLQGSKNGLTSINLI